MLFYALLIAAAVVACGLLLVLRHRMARVRTERRIERRRRSGGWQAGWDLVFRRGPLRITDARRRTDEAD